MILVSVFSLSVFAAKRSIYTAQKGTDALAALEAAVALPDEAARKALHVVLRIDLVALGGQCRIIWDELDSMIRDSFPDNQYETRRNEAGHGFYAGLSSTGFSVFLRRRRLTSSTESEKNTAK
jgi:hypothetical protein